MKALLICPADRPGVAHLAENVPLAVAPLLGKSLVEYWLESFAARGAHEVTILASDRPDQVRTVVGDGTRWGLRVDLLPKSRELTVPEARSKYRGHDADGWMEEDVVLMDTLPGLPGYPLFETYAGWFAALRAWTPRAITPARIGVREIEPGVWVGLHAQIASNVQLRAPCWIGNQAMIAPGAIIGPKALVEDRVVVEHDARIVESVVGPETFVGPHIVIERSLASGSTVVNWKSGSCLHVPDAFLLCSLDARRFTMAQPGLFARALAALAMTATAPAALVAMGIAVIRGESPLQLRLGVRPQRNARRGPLRTFAYYELTGAGNWLRRWPQFWNVVRGDFTWFGNRPLRPTQALALANDFERLWLAAPVGLVSLADACGCWSDLTDEACAHASYYAVNASRSLDWLIFRRSLLRAASAWPLMPGRRKNAGVPLPQLVPKQEG
ncbi:MAG: sugar transferase [Opitutaceae bacterium]|nr:sugar transferase [Opitutaceae bacterium]